LQTGCPHIGAEYFVLLPEGFAEEPPLTTEEKEKKFAYFISFNPLV